MASITGSPPGKVFTPPDSALIPLVFGAPKVLAILNVLCPVVAPNGSAPIAPDVNPAEPNAVNPVLIP
jgi:hypothetical protein